ncbi:Tim44 domain-containing protein [Hydrogenophaga sp.]|uniref:Tim44 domain-containing protein n=1 Tax=Hydrogenophaga sp. TaxID=1904254 RepID=UPI003569878A
MRFFSLFAVVLVLGLSQAVSDAEAARRIGGGKSTGMQRQNTTSNPAPAQTAAAPATAGAAAATPPKRSWMGPVAGLAAGLGIAALASHLGLGEGLANMLMIGLLVMAVMAALAFVMRKRALAQTPAMAGARSSTAAPHRFEVAMPARASESMIGSGIGANVASTRAIPADFDAAGFARNAKVQFIRLQAANDAGDLDDIRAFTTPEMFAELAVNMSERSASPPSTDVVGLQAEVVEVVEEATRYTVSVRFTGTIREEKDLPAEAFDEMWHLTKPRVGNGGWQLAGIQQLQ